MIIKISPKGVSSSDFIRIFAVTFRFLLVCNCSTKISEISDMAKSYVTRDIV